MKQCPECRKVYVDDLLNFCLDDGAWLREASEDEPATAIQPPAESSAAGALTTEQTAVLSEPGASTGDEFGGAQRPASSAEYLISEVRNHRHGVAMVLGAAIVALVGIGYWYLQSRSATVSPSPIASIAVLPFQNRNSDPDTDYLSDGLAESLIFRLSQLPGLKVSPTTSVIRYKGSDLDMKKVASDLGVDSIMTGRLLKRGDNLNITVELIDTRSNTSLWGEQYERRMSDLLATQREIAATIAQKLQLKLAGDEKGVTKRYTDNNDAYQLYLKGRYHFARRTKSDMERSIELLRQATEIDPNFALAYVGIAESYTTMPSYPYMSPQEAYPKAKAAIAKALELDPDLPEAHAVAGMLAAADDWDYPKAEREFKRAIELGPELAITHFRYGWTYLNIVGRHDEAIAEMKRAMELEPLSVQQGANYASVLLYARRFDDALVQARKTYELDPDHVGARNWLCYTLNANGLYAEAQAIGEKALDADPNRVNLASACLGIAYAKTGQREKALEVIARVKEAAKTRYVMTYWLAVQYAALGDKNNAFAELEVSFRNHDWFLPRMKVDPFMDPLRDDPRFDEMVKRLHLPE